MANVEAGKISRASVDRLIRALCAERTRELYILKDTEANAIPDSTPLKQTSVEVQRAVARLRKLRPLVRAAERVIGNAGFSTYDLCGTSLNRLKAYNERQQRRNKFKTQKLAVAAVKNRYLVEMIGMTEASARPLLRRLQIELAKV